MSQLTNYIQKEQEKGFSQDLITKKLLQAGYNKQEIAESFKSLKSAEPLLLRKALDTIHQDTHVKWSKFVFPLLAIFIVVALGYLVYQYQGEFPSLPTSTEPDSCDFPTIEEKNICLLQLAQQGEDVCDQLSTPVLKTMCTEKYWDKDKCNFEFLVSKNTTSREDCLWKQAVTTQDASYCNKKVHDKIKCLVQLAEETKDASVCSSFLTCYQQYAVLSKDIAVCESLFDDYEKELCASYYANNINS